MLTPAAAPSFAVIGIVTADLAAALAFYRRLGLAVPADSDEAPHVEVELPGGLRLAFDPESTIRSFDPSFTAPTGAGRIALAFDCGFPGAVDTLYAQLTDAGAPSHLAPFDAPWGQRYATVLDPDGNGIDLFAAQPIDATGA